MNTKGHPLRVAFFMGVNHSAAPVRHRHAAAGLLPGLPVHHKTSAPCPSLARLPVQQTQKSPPHYRGTIEHGTNRGTTLPIQ